MRVALALAAVVASSGVPSGSRVPSPSGSRVPSPSISRVPSPSGVSIPPGNYCQLSIRRFLYPVGYNITTLSLPGEPFCGGSDACQRACCARPGCLGWRFDFWGMEAPGAPRPDVCVGSCSIAVTSEPVGVWAAIASRTSIQTMSRGRHFQSGRYNGADGKVACCAQVPSGSASASRAPPRSAAATASRSHSRSRTRTGSRTRKPK